VLTREAALAEGIPGGYSAVYPVLKLLEESGRVRRGYFVEGLGATQFALPGAEDRLRLLRMPPASALPARILSAADPASPYGAALPWPRRDDARLERRAGARVILQEGALVAFLARSERDLVTFLPAEEPSRGDAARAIVSALAGMVGSGRRPAILISTVDGGDPGASPLAPFLEAAGFTSGARGYLRRPEASDAGSAVSYPGR
jgi:ATP-dependent Lhr-like helicase